MPNSRVRSLFGLLVLLLPLQAFADIPWFGPQTYTRSTGQPQTVTNTFSVSDLTGPFTLLVQNGDGKQNRASSATIQLNGSQVVSPNDFNQQTGLITKQITLRAQNTLSVTVASAPSSYIYVTILGPGNPLSPVEHIDWGRAAPDGVFVNSSTLVTLTAQVVQAPTLITSSVTLSQVDSSGNLLNAIGQMYDDGTHGDALAGDGIFSLQITPNESTSSTLFYRVSAGYTDTPLHAVSPLFRVNVVNHLSDTDAAIILSTPAATVQHYSALIQTGLSRATARAQTITWVQTQPGVLQAGASDSGTGIWILYTSGVLGGAMLNPPGTKGGGVSHLGPPHQGIQLFPALMQSSSAGTVQACGNLNAVVIDPFSFSPDEATTIPQILQQGQCPFQVTTASGNVSGFKNLGNYGVVVISSHGDTWYRGLLSLYQTRFGWNGFFGQVIIKTSEVATPASIQANAVDLQTGRLVVTDENVYAITPNFITEYSGSFPNSIVYVSSCRSAFNSTMANAFLQSGASTYFGYTEYVFPSFAYAQGNQLFTKLITYDPNTGRSQTTGQAFAPATDVNVAEDATGPASFVMFGSQDTTLPTNLVGNGSFEAGLTSWTVTGAGYSSVVSGNATDGTSAIRIGRFDEIYAGGVNGQPQPGAEPSGYDAVYQDVQLPSAGQSPLTLKFDYDIQSFDAIPWDWFDMKVLDATTGATLASVVHDGKPGTQWGTFWDGGWHSVTYDLTPFAGRKVRLWFGTAEDGYGDQTATWVDHVTISCP